MATPTTRNRKKKSNAGAWLVAGLLLVSGAVVLGFLHFTGKLKLPFLPAREAQAKDDSEGKVAVPIAVRPISIFRAVKRDDLYNPEKRQIAYVWVKEEDAKQKGFVSNYQSIVGRVMRFDKQAGYAFKETDFYPPGSLETPALGIEKDMIGKSLDPEQISGLANLTTGARFQVRATLPESVGSGNLQGSDYGSPSAARTAEEESAWQAREQLVVRDGKVILAGLRTKGASKDDQAFFVQLSPKEEKALEQALAKRARLSCSQISALAPKDLVPGAAPADAIRDTTEEIEILSSGKPRKVRVEKTDPNGPQDGAASPIETEAPPR